MDIEEVWNLWLTLAEYINKKDVNSAFEQFLNYLYEINNYDLTELEEIIESEDEQGYLKIIKRFIKEYGLDEEDY